jgi:hypothetical protein
MSLYSDAVICQVFASRQTSSNQFLLASTDLMGSASYAYGGKFWGIGAGASIAELISQS